MDWSAPFALEADDPVDRVGQLISNLRTGNLYYTVVRAETLKTIVQLLRDVDLSETLLGYEIALTAGLAVAGRYEMGDYAFWCRMGGSLSGSTLRETLNAREKESLAQYLIDLDLRLGSRNGSTTPIDSHALRTRLYESLLEFDERRLSLPPVKTAETGSRHEDQIRGARLISSFEGTDILLNLGALDPTALVINADELVHLATTALNGLRPVESLTEP
jgi:hypothetical protein